MQTVSELNTKWWYRLVKVVYLVALVVVSLSVANTVLNNTAPYMTIDLDKSTLVCLKGGGLVNYVISFSEVNRIENSSVAYRVLEKDWDRDDLIGRLCNIKDRSDNSGSYIAVNSYNWRQEVLSLHRLDKVDKQIGNWYLTFFYGLFSLFVVCMFFEILRRSFYYVVLGSLKPKK